MNNDSTAEIALPFVREGNGGSHFKDFARFCTQYLDAEPSSDMNDLLFRHPAPSLPVVARVGDILSSSRKIHTGQDSMTTALPEARIQKTIMYTDMGRVAGRESMWFSDVDREPTNDAEEKSFDLDDVEDEDDDDEAFAAVEASDYLLKRRGPPDRLVEHSMRIEAPTNEIYELLYSRGFISQKQKRPTPNDSVLSQEDHRIVAWYRNISTGLLNYYSCCDNFLKVKAIVNYHLRWSAIHTLSKKHKSSSHQIIKKYGKNLVVTHNGKNLASFLSPEEIKRFQKGFSETDPVPPELLIDVLYTKMKRRSREEKKRAQ